MNNGSAQIYASIYSQIVSDDITEAQASLPASSLLFYASFLHFPDEVRYIWKPKLTLSTFFYLLAQYSTILLLIGRSIQNISLSASLYSLRVCNALGFLNEALSICGYIGVQGLISLRTYSICRGYHPMAIALTVTFFIPIFLQIYVITVPSCTDALNSTPLKFNMIGLVRNIATNLSDGLAFIGIIHQVWRIWKLKRGVSFQSNDKDLVTSLLQQGFLRFFFVLFISNTTTILELVLPLGTATGVFSAFQETLSVIIICEFTIALRRRNMNKSIPNQSAINLPTLSLPSQDDPMQTQQSILERIHESLVVEMVERSDPAVIDNRHNIEAQDVNPITAV